MSNTIQPALIIGLGGSGIEIVRRFKRRFVEQYPDTPYVRFLGIDTAPQTAGSPELPQLADEEFVWSSSFQMQFFTSPGYIERFPEIQRWWKGYDQIAPAYIAAGAGQRRPVGRLALFVRFEEIRTRLQGMVRDVYSSATFSNIPPQYRRAINVYVVSSTCGGTGTGMFLDVAYLAHMLVPEVAPQALPAVRAMLLMPSVFTGTGQVPSSVAAQLQANAYGALTELDYCTTASVRRGKVMYPGGREVDRDAVGRPFQSCFFIGNQDARGSVYRSAEEVYERAAVQLQIDLASEISEAGGSRMDNVLAAIGAAPDLQGHSRLYSAFNGDWLELPGRRVAVRWQKRLAERVLRRIGGSTRGRSSQSVDGAVGMLRSEPGFAAVGALVKGGIAALSPDVGGFMAAFRDVGVDGSDPAVLRQHASTLQEEADRLLRRSPLRQRAGDALGAMAEEIDTALRRVLSEGSAADARVLCDAVSTTFDEWEELVRRNRKSGESWLQAFTTQSGTFKKGLLESKGAFAERQQALVSQAAGDAEEEWRRTLWSMLGDELQESTHLPLLRRHLRRRSEQMERLAALAEGAAGLVARHPEPPVPAGMSFGIGSDEETDAAFEDASRQERLTALARPHLGVILHNGLETAESLAAEALRVAGDAVREVVDEYLKATDIPSADIARRLNALAPLVVFTPEWRALEGTPQFPAPLPLRMVGMPDRMRAAESEVTRQLEVEHREVEMLWLRNADRVIMTTQTHGFPLFALAELQECKRAFEMAERRSQPLRFTLPEATSWRLQPVSSTDAMQYFGVALATGRVWKAASEKKYFFSKTGIREGRQELADAGVSGPDDARRTARESFVSAGFVEDVRHEIAPLIDNALTKAEFMQHLVDWADAQEKQAAADRDFPQEFLTEVRQVREFVRAYRY